MPKRCLSFLLLFLLLLLALTGCTRSPQRLTPTPALSAVQPPAFVNLPAEQAIPQLIAAEREASRLGDEATLSRLWAEGGRIVDSRGTDDPADDFTWPNRAAILDRYRLAVFPAAAAGVGRVAHPHNHRAGRHSASAQRPGPLGVYA